MRITLFKQKGPKGFNFKPRYYDAEREELMARVDLLKRDLEAADQAEAEATYHGGEALRQRLRANRGHYSQVSKARKKSNIRMLFIVGALVLAFYLFWMYS